MTDLWGNPAFSRTIQDWQGIVDLVVRMAGVRACLVMRVHDDDIEVFVSSQSAGNPYKVGDKEKLLDSGLYCERVIATQERLLVPNALKSAEWRNNPDIHLNMISYLGFPIKLPDGRPFGTICLLDDRENAYSQDVAELMRRMRDLIESHLTALADITERKAMLAELRRHQDHLEELVQERTRDLEAEIAERAAAQAALERSEMRLKAAERVARMGSWEQDLITGELSLSDGLYRLLGLNPEMPGQAAYAAAWDAMHPEDLAGARGVFARDG